MNIFRLLCIFLTINVATAFSYSGFDIKLSSPLHSVDDIYSYKELSKRFQDGFGAYRNRGHLHAAQDIKGSYGEDVYPVANGMVVAIWGKFPYKTIAILHKDSEGKLFFTSSVHLGEAYVEPGDYVDTDMRIGRLLNKEEQKRAYYSKVHLHLEFRKTLESFRTSAQCFTMEQLNAVYFDPKPFFKEHMN